MISVQNNKEICAEYCYSCFKSKLNLSFQIKFTNLVRKRKYICSIFTMLGRLTLSCKHEVYSAKLFHKMNSIAGNPSLLKIVQGRFFYCCCFKVLREIERKNNKECLLCCMCYLNFCSNTLKLHCGNSVMKFIIHSYHWMKSFYTERYRNWTIRYMHVWLPQRSM